MFADENYFKRTENRVQSEKSIALYRSCRFSWTFVASFYLIRSCMALLWSFGGFTGLVVPVVWSFVAFECFLLQNINLIGLVQFFLEVIDPNSDWSRKYFSLCILQAIKI